MIEFKRVVKFITFYHDALNLIFHKFQWEDDRGQRKK